MSSMHKNSDLLLSCVTYDLDDLALMGKFKASNFRVSEVLKRGSIFIFITAIFAIVASKILLNLMLSYLER